MYINVYILCTRHMQCGWERRNRKHLEALGRALPIEQTNMPMNTCLSPASRCIWEREKGTRRKG
jgi:hypothetical protein